MASAAESDRLDPQLIRIGLVVVSGIIMSLLDTTIVNVALDTLSQELDAGLATIQWVVTGYLLALAVVIPITGWAVGRFGAKRLFMLSIALFIAGSVLCAVAWDVYSLIGFRVLQGLGGGLLMPVGQTILALTAGPKRMARMMSVIGIPMLLGPILGPVIGGLIVDNLAWEWIFLVNLPIGLVSLVLVKRTLPDDRPTGAGALDVVGLALISPGVALIVFGLSRAGVVGTFGAVSVWAPAAAGAALLGAFVIYARNRGENALIPLVHFRERAFAAASAVVTVISIALFGAMLVLPLYYQQLRGADALEAGLLLAPQGIGAALAMPIAGTLSDRIGARYVVLPGLVLVLLGSLPFTQVSMDTSYWLLGSALVVRGFGIGATMMPSIAAGYRNLPASAAGHASSSLNIFRQLGATTGSALLAVILAHSIATGAAPDEAFDTTFWWAVAITALGLPFALLLPGRPAPVEQEPAVVGRASSQ